MPAKTKPGRNLSLSQKFSRLCSRLGEPEWRRYGGTLFARDAMLVQVHAVEMTYSG
jgi:hypothetical protein